MHSAISGRVAMICGLAREMVALGISGATGAALFNILTELRNDIDQCVPQLRLVSGMTDPQVAGATANLEAVVEKVTGEK